jgi:hypothetical protein
VVRVPHVLEIPTSPCLQEEEALSEARTHVTAGPEMQYPPKAKAQKKTPLLQGIMRRRIGTD